MSAALTLAVVTRNRARSLGGTLAALLAQDLADGAFEILVVDDRSTDDTAASARAIGARSRVPLRVVTGPGRGIGAARNVALRECATPLIAFTDDDCLPSPGWARLLRDAALSSTDVAAAAGRTVNTPRGALFADFATFVGIHNAQRRPPGNVVAAPTVNVLYRQERALEVGGFDERLPSGEDVAMSSALRRRGWRIAWVPDALVEHRTDGGLHYVLKRTHQWGIDDARRREGEPLALTALRIAYRSRVLFSWSGLPVAWWTNEADAERLRDRALFPVLRRLRDSVHVAGEWRGLLERVAGGHDVDPARY